MNPALAALAVGVVAGGVVAVSARDARVSIVGLAVALGFAPLIAEPFPNALVLGARVVAALLAAYLLWIVARDGFDVRHARLRPPVELLMAAAAGLAGLSSAALTTPPTTEIAVVGLPVARGAAFAIGAMAVIPILEGRDSLRLGTGLLLAVLAAALLEQGMGSSISPVAHLAFAAVIVGVATTCAGLGALSLRSAERAERPVRAGAHPLGYAGDAAGPILTGARGAEMAIRRRLADARVADRLVQARTRSGVAVSRVRSTQLGERAVDQVRRRLEWPVAAQPEPAVDAPEAAPPDVPTARESRVPEPPAPGPEPVAPSSPTTISPRSAGARRSLRRE
jgi:hypothetical protein